MGTVVDVSLPTDQFALGDTLQAMPEASVETVRVAAHGPRGVMPFLWANADDTDRLDGILRSDETTHQVTCLSRGDTRALYSVRWDESVRMVIRVFVEANGSLLRAEGQTDRWELRVLFPDRSSVSSTYEAWREYGLDPSVHQITGVSNIASTVGGRLSSCQHETLMEAFETDYYDVPRGIKLDSLAEQLNVSHQALSERLRRGHRNLIESTLRESPTSVGDQL